MMKVPSVLHGNVAHIGGVSTVKKIQIPHSDSRLISLREEIQKQIFNLYI